RVAEVRRMWSKTTSMERIWKNIFLALSVVWIVLVLIFGLDDRSYLFHNYIKTIILPLGGMTGLIVAVRAYFKGYGAMISMIFGALGVASAFIPYNILKYVDTNIPSLFHLVVAVLTVAYVAIALLTDFSKDRHTDMEFVDNVLSNQDVRSTLLDPLYYTFKTRSHRYKASNFGQLDEVADQTHSISGEVVIHYVLWTLTVIVLLLELFLLNRN
ncbi:MAG: hypothetical protein K2O54_07155, partial [Prevotella sp.]|nr:hypothetical protein [Prevotella sp.]